MSAHRKEVSMRKFIVAAVVLAAVIGASVAYSAASPSAKLAKQDRVWGGGVVAASTCSINYPFCIGPTARNVAVDAHAEGDGAEAAGNSSYASQPSRTVTCLSVNGNEAAIGGVVLATVNGVGNPGDYYVLYVIDRGSSAPGSPPDLVSALYEGPPSDWSGGFPYVCPPAEGADSTDVAFLETAGGDINVQDAPSN
jgi:hypothetical protein